MKRITGLLFLVFGFLLLVPLTVFAVPASPDIVDIVQPDQVAVKVQLRGDEWNNVVETLEGYTIAEGPGGYWHYVAGYDGIKPVLHQARADEPAPAGLMSELRPSIENIMMPSAAASSEGLAKAPYGAFNGKILFILARFSNRAGTYTAPTFASFITNKINHFFNKASYGKVTLSPAAETHGTANDGVVGWVNLGYAHPNTGGTTNTQNQQIAKDAILKSNRYVNFKSFDTNSDGYVDSNELAVVVIVAGYERSYSASYSPSVWGHKWSLDGVGAPTVDTVIVGADHNGQGGYAQFGEVHQSKAGDKHQATMGIMVHELGHLIFGLPDLYDTDSSSSGIGAFCVMAGGSWGKSDAATYSGQTPVLPSAWIKYNRGWVNGTAVGNAIKSIKAAGSGLATSGNTVFRKSTDTSTQYFLAEIRRPIGYDMGLQKWFGADFGGTAIWHVDETMTANSDDTHRLVDLEEADGIQMGSSAGAKTDLWYVGNKTKFNNNSDSNSKKYDLTSTCIQINTQSAPATTMNVEFKKTATCPCEAENCGIFTGNCNPTKSPCFCFRKMDGTGTCVDDFWCSSAEACGSDGDCPAGKQCVKDSCCGAPVCAPTSCTGTMQGVFHLSDDITGACTFKY